MIIVRGPLRITLAGGGTDVPIYSKRFGGFSITATINKYVYVGLTRPFEPGIYLKYAQLERTCKVEEIKHPVFKAVLSRHLGQPPQIEITSLADIPAGTGLGSSAAFTTALIAGMRSMANLPLGSPVDIAEASAGVEMGELGEPSGKQDHYAVALGGVQQLTFDKDGSVKHAAMAVPDELQQRLLMFFMGYMRESASILKLQETLLRYEDQAMLESMHQSKSIALQIRDILAEGLLDDFGVLLHKHWCLKRERLPSMSNGAIDHWYEWGIHHGATGGKLIGAGGGGFLLFYSPEPDQLRRAAREAGLQELPFKFDFEGLRVMPT